MALLSIHVHMNSKYVHENVYTKLFTLHSCCEVLCLISPVQLFALSYQNFYYRK